MKTENEERVTKWKREFGKWVLKYKTKGDEK